MQNHPGGPSLLGWVAIQYAADRLFGSMNLLNLETGENRTVVLPGRPGFFAETVDPGVVLIGMERRFVTCNLLTGAVAETGLTVTEDPRVIINDGLAVDGGVLFGTKHLGFELPIAGLYYLDSASRQIHQVLDQQVCSNGKYLLREGDGATVIDIDSQPKKISVYHFDSKLRTLRDQRTLRDPAKLPGFPDGMRLAPGGNSVVVAFYNPAAVADGLAQQIALDTGEIECEWVIPGSPRITCPEFVLMGGEVKIVLTTAVEGMPAATRALAPGAGSMYLADTPFAAVPKAPPLVPLLN